MNRYTETQFEGKIPKLHEKSFVAEGAIIIGDVTLGEYSSVWYNAVLRGDINRIIIGRYVNIQDNSVIHVDDDLPAEIGDFVTVGHNAIVHACRVEDHCLIGMGAVVLNGAVIGRGSIVAAGAVVTPRTQVPPFSLIAGVPGKVIKHLPEDTAAQHAHAVKYKTLWCERYAVFPDDDGEKYHEEKISPSSNS